MALQDRAKAVTDGGTAGQEVLLERMAIRELLENWVIWRDAGDWQRFATVWHDEGRMVATWFQASASQFIEECQKSFDAGNVSMHLLGGSSIDVNDTRAVAQTKMQIVFRGEVHGEAVIVTCLGRFVDALEKRANRWGMVLRQPVYELDWLTPEKPSARLKLDDNLLNSFPLGYRHVAYVQTQMGIDVSRNLPSLHSLETDNLLKRMSRWLAGGPTNQLANMHWLSDKN